MGEKAAIRQVLVNDMASDESERLRTMCGSQCRQIMVTLHVGTCLPHETHNLSDEQDHIFHSSCRNGTQPVQVVVVVRHPKSTVESGAVRQVVSGPFHYKGNNMISP
jgi:hypothetical protein